MTADSGHCYTTMLIIKEYGSVTDFLYPPPLCVIKFFNPMWAHQIELFLLKSDGAICKQEKININSVQA